MWCAANAFCKKSIFMPEAFASAIAARAAKSSPAGAACVGCVGKIVVAERGGQKLASNLTEVSF
jgi:hypothetical protein